MITPFWGLLLLLNINSKSGVVFTPEKEFFKLLLGVKITPKKITPLEGS